MKIRMPKVIWVLGDPEQSTQSGVTIVRRPLWYSPRGDGVRVRVGVIDPDYAEPLMAALTASVVKE